MTLSTLAAARGFTGSDLARAAKVSRAAVSLWMNRPSIDVKASHLHRLAERLGVTMELLMSSLPLIEDKKALESAETSLLWDRLYPTMPDFAVALARFELRAVARLVEVNGIFAGEKIVGRRVWSEFEKYKRFIHPTRRKECESLCGELKRLNLS